MPEEKQKTSGVQEGKPTVSHTPALARQQWWSEFPNIRMVLGLLVVIIAVGAFLRFWQLGQQSYWHDESRTVGRIVKPLDQMLDELARTQGFAPGWYMALHWWQVEMAGITGSVAKSFSPEYLRAFPALLGTLLIPGMYFLARQFMDRRGALLVALLAAVNPYLIYYSRDCKMYMACWMFLTWHIAFLLAWWNDESKWRWWGHAAWYYWLGMIVCGAAAVAVHSIALLIVPLELIWLLTRGRIRAFDIPLWLVGVAAMLALPLWWYTARNRWLLATAEGGYAGLEWNMKAFSMEWPTIWGLGTAHLFGYLWPKELPNNQLAEWNALGGDFNNHLATRYLPWLVQLQTVVGCALGAILVLGLLPWRWVGRKIRKLPPTARQLREKQRRRGQWWWVALWIILPVAGFASTWIPHDNWWYLFFWGWLKKYFHNERGIISLWEPRYLGIIIPALILWLGAALYRLPFRWFRWPVVVMVVGVSVTSALSNHLLYRQEPFGPTARVLKEYWKANDGSVALVTPTEHYPDQMDRLSLELPLDVAPKPRQSDIDMDAIHSYSARQIAQEKEALFQLSNWKRNCRDEEYVYFLRRMKNSKKVMTIIVTDRQGDLTDGPLTDQAVQSLLGPNWKLTHSETYRWCYEWRYYFFHVWRTRVWVRNLPATLPATAP